MEPGKKSLIGSIASIRTIALAFKVEEAKWETVFKGNSDISLQAIYYVVGKAGNAPGE